MVQALMEMGIRPQGRPSLLGRIAEPFIKPTP